MVELKDDGSETPLASGTAAAGKVYFVINKKSDGTTFDSYTFVPTKVGETDVTGLVEATVPSDKATSGDGFAASSGKIAFFFDVYNQNNGAYAVKVIKVVD